MSLCKLKTAILLLCTLFIFSCGKETTVVVDNPTNKMIKVAFENGYEVHVPAFGSKRLNFDNLKSSIKLNDQPAENFELEAGKEYLLNPCKASYFVEAFEYGNAFGANLAGQKKSINGIPLNISQVDEQPVIGYFLEFQNLLIERQWDWDLKKSVPKQIEVEGYNATTARTKIFRKSAFLSFHKRQGM